MTDRPSTPMMKQYFEIKDKYSDCLLFYRLGDFYEMFFDDAIFASRELELTLTGRDCGMEERAPMCGVPFHAAEIYINRLVSKGYKIAICEQVEDPTTAKGLVKRDVIKVITAGTITNSETLQSDKPNYLMSLYFKKNCFGIACTDILTGDFFVNEVDNLNSLYDEIGSYKPSEIIVCADILENHIDKGHRALNGIIVSTLADEYFDENAVKAAILEKISKDTLDKIGLSLDSVSAICAGAIVLYLKHTQRNSDFKLSEIRNVIKSDFMLLDDFSRKNLELVESLSTKQKKGSLLSVLDKTMTAMGGRKLREFVISPLYSIEKIEYRQSIIEELFNNKVALSLIRSDLSRIYDIDRLMGRIIYNNATPKDLLALKSSIEYLPKLKEYTKRLNNAPITVALMNNIDSLNEVFDLINSSISNDAGISSRDGKIIKSGYNSEVDRLRSADTDGNEWLMQLEAREKQRTGIKSLKIKNSRVFGHCIEVTNTYQDLVPDDYIRKQTLVNAQRYTTEELNNMSELILSSKDKLLVLEYDIFVDIRNKIADFSDRLRYTTDILGKLDAFCSLAFVALANNYVKPRINLNGILDIKNGRHPVVESMLDTNAFIANDTYLDTKKDMIAIITGPNMAGKSTYMRQVALIVVMAHMGSFVPAQTADICLTDRIFTRVGASDDLASGMSTFMVEMTEVAHILKNATKNSLLILDEIGRGTGTIDGLSIAWAVIEYISNKERIGAKTLFATHYHELSRLEGKLDGIRNYSIAVKENGDDIVFLRKIINGGANKSYGIQVASLAGVPKPVIDRATTLLLELKDNDLMDKIKHIDMDNGDTMKDTFLKEGENEQLNIFKIPKQQISIINKLQGLKLDSITPLDAMNILYELRKELKED